MTLGLKSEVLMGFNGDNFCPNDAECEYFVYLVL